MLEGQQKRFIVLYPDRKFFHIIVVIVYTVGVVVDKSFLFFASTVVFAVQVRNLFITCSENLFRTFYFSSGLY